MASWIQEASMLVNDLESPAAVDKILKIVKDKCKTQEDFEFLSSSDVLKCMLKLHRDGEEAGSVLSDLIGKVVVLFPKERTGLKFLMRIIPELEKEDELYKKCRRLFVGAYPELSIGGIGNSQFFHFFKEIVDQVHTEMINVFASDSTTWPNLSSLSRYISFLERAPDEFRCDVSFHKKFESLVSLMDNILTSLLKRKLSMYIDLIKQLTRLERVILGREESLRNIVNRRAHEIIDLAVESIENGNCSELDERWLREQSLLLPLFFSLIGKLDFVFQLVNEKKCSLHSLVTYNRTLQTATHIVKDVDGGETAFENLIEGRKEEYNVMRQMVTIHDLKFCPDETLLCLDSLRTNADAELKKWLALSIVPKIREGMPFEISISRDLILDESRKCIIKASSNDLSGSLFVKFKTEEGIGSGVTKEWLCLVIQKMLDPGYKYFKRDREDQHQLLPTLEPVTDLHFYIFFGRMMALALKHHVQVGVTLDPILVLMLAELEVNLEDVEKSDPDLHKHMMEDVKSYVDIRDTGEAVDIERDYSKSLVNETIIQLIDEKVTNIKCGFDCVFGTPLRRRIFFGTIEPCHLDMVICGDPGDISVEDWEHHTDYDRNDPYICSFWKIVGEFSAEERKELLFFWSAIRFLPPGGFGNLEERPVIKRTNENSSYPRANTCDSTLHIPSAPYEDLKYRLHTSIKQPATFGFQ